MENDSAIYAENCCDLLQANVGWERQRLLNRFLNVNNFNWSNVNESDEFA